MANLHHKVILNLIQKNSVVANQHTFLDNYLGTTRPRYQINTPALRTIAKEWMKAQRMLTAEEIADLVESLVRGKSSTEKAMAGILLDYTTAEQRKFQIQYFDQWIEHLTGWAEVDAVCSGKYTAWEIPVNDAMWAKMLQKFSKSKNIHKRRAALVMLVSPLRSGESQFLAETGLRIISNLKHEKEILVTKAISWLLRSMIKHQWDLVGEYLETNRASLPAIAVRETTTKLKTGRKSKTK